MARAKPAADTAGPGERTGNGSYGPTEVEEQLPSYSAVLSIYGTLLFALTIGLARRNRLPERIGPLDLVTAGIATHRLTRTIAKEKVASPLRAPFVELEDEEGPPGEVQERVRAKSGPGRIIGELLTCPFCLAQWFGTAFAAGLAAFPRVTRFVTGVFSITAIADFLHLIYRGAGDKLLKD